MMSASKLLGWEEINKLDQTDSISLLHIYLISMLYLVSQTAHAEKNQCQLTVPLLLLLCTVWTPSYINGSTHHSITELT